MNFLKKLFKPEPIITFKALDGYYNVSTPIQPSAKIRADWMRKQDKFKFTSCPGIYDFASMGYMLTSYVDFYIKANSAGVAIVYKNPAVPIWMKEVRLDHKLVDGMINFQNVPPNVLKIPLPWSISTKPGWSLMYLPPIMHSGSLMEDLCFYPGVIDSDKYFHANFVFSVKNECEVFVPAGTPLVQIVPFKREKITATCTRATEKEQGFHKFSFPRINVQYYRKKLWNKKSYTMEYPDNLEGQKRGLIDDE
jgi:hypothetical protein